VPVLVVEPWSDARWDAYVASHPLATAYHASTWIRLVCETGRYPSSCLLCERDGVVAGVLPLVVVDSRLTGRRVSTLPFSDTCFAIADDEESAHALIQEARAIRARRGAAFYEMRGTLAVRDGERAPPAGFARSSHFVNYLLPLSRDPEALLATFSKKAVRYMITKGERSLTVRRGNERDVDAFYRLYVRTRRRHGVPPQPQHFFADMLAALGQSAALHVAEHEGRAIAAVLTLHFRDVTYLKYEVVDERQRHLAPIHLLLWETIKGAALAGDRVYDFGRTAVDNTGLNEFKQRWGTTRVDLPYYFDPAHESSTSVARSDSLKYRLFTTAFRRMPESWSIQIGRRIFRHFG
jgi:FemAB-related protein (PEP-CTERM system-associated)